MIKLVRSDWVRDGGNRGVWDSKWIDWWVRDKYGGIDVEGMLIEDNKLFWEGCNMFIWIIVCWRLWNKICGIVIGEGGVIIIWYDEVGKKRWVSGKIWDRVF